MLVSILPLLCLMTWFGFLGLDVTEVHHLLCPLLPCAVPSEITCVCSSEGTGNGSGMRSGRGSGWQVWRERHPDGVWEVTGTPHTARQCPLPAQGLAALCCCSPHQGSGEEPCSPAGRRELLFLPGMAPMVCQSSGGAARISLCSWRSWEASWEGSPWCQGEPCCWFLLLLCPHQLPRLSSPPSM